MVADLDPDERRGNPTGTAGRRVLLLVNPRSRRGDSPLNGVIDVLQQAGMAVLRESVETPEEVSPDIIRRAYEVDCVVVCGGDGSVNAAARGILATGLPLGIIPLGTGNDLARTLGLPLDPVAAAAIVAAGATRLVDVGEVNGHPFFNVASLGISTALAEELTREVKRRWGRLGYALAAVSVLLKARPFTARIVSTSDSVTVHTMQVAVGNGRHYGGGMTVSEDAAIDDGELDLYSLEFPSVWSMVLMLPAFVSGAQGRWREVRTVRCASFEIRTRRPRKVSADGEVVTQTPARFRVLPAAVHIFVPPGA
jgi:YegS/Rv2252/BmrU family lipid kinase